MNVRKQLRTVLLTGLDNKVVIATLSHNNKQEEKEKVDMEVEAEETETDESEDDELNDSCDLEKAYDTSDELGEQLKFESNKEAFGNNAASPDDEKETNLTTSSTTGDNGVTGT